MCEEEEISKETAKQLKHICGHRHSLPIFVGVLVAGGGFVMTRRMIDMFKRETDATQLRHEHLDGGTRT